MVAKREDADGTKIGGRPETDLCSGCATAVSYRQAQKTPGTARCRVFSFALLACHPAAGAALSTGALLAVCRILLHPLLIALHILWA